MDASRMRSVTRSAVYFPLCTPTTAIASPNRCSSSRNCGSTWLQLIQPYVQKSSSSSLPRKSPSVSRRPAVCSQSSVSGKWGARATLNPRYTLLQFAVGRSNEGAYAAASAAAVAPGTLYNPSLLVGGTGLGKTHLAHAVTAEAALRDPLRVAELLTADDFLHRLSTALGRGTPELILDERARASLIVADDVHVLD